jgi:hypothetical protein
VKTGLEGDDGLTSLELSFDGYFFLLHHVGDESFQLVAFLLLFQNCLSVFFVYLFFSVEVQLKLRYPFQQLLFTSLELLHQPLITVVDTPKLLNNFIFPSAGLTLIVDGELQVVKVGLKSVALVVQLSDHNSLVLDFLLVLGINFFQVGYFFVVLLVNDFKIHPHAVVCEVQLFNLVVKLLHNKLVFFGPGLKLIRHL